MLSSFINSSLLETIICLVLIYAVLSIFASTIVEGLNFYFKERGKMLYNSISAMFEDRMNVNFGQLLYDHPIVAALRKDRSNLPQYISPEIFANCIIDVIGNYSRRYEYSEAKNSILLINGDVIGRSGERDDRNLFERCRDTVLQLEHTEVKLLLMNMIEKSRLGIDNESVALQNFQQQLQQWFNAQMDRTTGWYKTKTSVRLRWVSFFIALGLNINSINIFTSLLQSPDVRAQILPIAESVAKDYQKLQADTLLTQLNQAYMAISLQRLNKDSLHYDSAQKIIGSLKTIDSLTRKIDSLHTSAFKSSISLIDSLHNAGVPFGWKKNFPPLNFGVDHKNWWANLMLYILGIFITVYAICAGAPFWFDLLAKFVNMRKAGVKPGDNKS